MQPTFYGSMGLTPRDIYRRWSAAAATFTDGEKRNKHRCIFSPAQIIKKIFYFFLSNILIFSKMSTPVENVEEDSSSGCETQTSSTCFKTDTKVLVPIYK